MAEVMSWRIAGRTALPGVPEQWREQLVSRLGQRPRRLGLLTELALYGALEALAEAGERSLPPDTLVRVSSLRGPVSAITQVLEQLESDLPLPFSFLQSQPSQLLAALASALQWQGDASFMPARDQVAMLTLAARQAGRRGLLVGWVEETEPRASHWLRLVPASAPVAPLRPLTSAAQLRDPQTHWLVLGLQGLSCA
ncbi:MAG TPA: hypothetical protein VGE00_08545 [Gammaproteobacteria bacterium]